MSDHETVDALSADFARVSQAMVTQQDKVKVLEEEVTAEISLLGAKGKDQALHKERCVFKMVEELSW